MLVRSFQRIVLLLLFVAFAGAMGSTVSASCGASADMATMDHAACGKAMPCKDMGAACAISVNCARTVGVLARDVVPSTRLAIMLVRRVPLVAQPNGLVVEPRLAPPKHLV